MSQAKELFQVRSYDPKLFRVEHDFVDEGRLLQVVDVILLGAPKENVRGSGNLVLSGPKGSGKDHLAMQSAINNAATVFKMQGGPNSTEWDLFGYAQGIGGDTKFVYGILPSACMHGLAHPTELVYIVIDEPNLMPSGVISSMNSMTDATRSIFVSFTGELITRPDNVKLIFTMNPWEQAGYSGTNQLNIATLDRFNIVEVDYLSVRSETQLLQKYNKSYDVCRKWAEFASKSREAYKQAEVTNVITTRNLIDYVQYIKVLPEKQVLKLALNQFLTDERAKVEKWWGGVENLKGDDKP